MIRTFGLLAGVSLAVLAGPVAAQQVEDGPGGPERVALTIYNQNIALVEDVRNLDIPAGRSRREFPGVSASIRPETVSLTGRGLSVVEQNFDFDLLTPDKMMTSAVGEEIEIIRTNPGTGAETRERARVLAANQGVVLQIGDRIEVLRDDGVPTRVVFDSVPENLRPRPTLSVTLNAEGGGRRETTLSYLTTGLTWAADYVANFDEGAGRMDLTGWITLTNQSGASFANADTRLVAGEVNLISGIGGGYYNPRSYGTEAGGAEGLADYYIYPLAERVTVANNQTKQVGLLDASGVAATKRYTFDSTSLSSNDNPSGANVALVFNNSREAGLGRALPAGIVRVYMKDASGQPRFIGENQIGHTSAGSEIRITTGSAFDVTVQPTLMASETVESDIKDRTRTRYSMQYLVRNARAEPVTVELRQSNLGGNAVVLAESQASERRNASTLVWQVRVPANGQTRLTARIETD